nr:PREDICTED: endogenous retrovirus group K member 113 Pol protein-like [Apteryx mantelli mantelli]
MVYTVCPPVFIPKGSKIAQLIAFSNPSCRSPQPHLYRGDRGFGSTGPAVCFSAKMDQRPMMKIVISQHGISKRIEAMLDTGADVTIISRTIWPVNWQVELPTSTIAGVGGQSAPYVSRQPVHLRFPEGQQACLKVLALGAGEQSPNPPLTWNTNEPVWVDQWPMSKERLQITEQLVAEQLASGHIKPSVSPWNTPIFVIPKKNGKWRLLHDLRKVNEQMQPMGALQPGMPSPSMLPEGWHLLIVDLKDCFFTIPLHPQDTQRFAFSVPAINKAAPAERYEWVVLPQGMKNSPTLCQLYVAWALQPLRDKWPDTIIYHYMDDILCCQEKPFVKEALEQLTDTLSSKGLIIAPEKIQRTAPWKYLGWSIAESKIRPQKTELTTRLSTLHDVQTLLGDVQWVRHCVGISNTDIAPLTALLRGTNPANKITLTPEQHAVLQRITQKLHLAWSSRRLLNLPISLIICNGKDSPYAVVCQWQNRSGESLSPILINATAKRKNQKDVFHILEWVFLSVQPKTSIQTRTEAVGELIRKGRSRILEISGQEPNDISIPVNMADLEWWLQNAVAIQNALLGFCGKVHSCQPQGKLWQVLQRNQWIEKSKVSREPLSDGVTVYTDAGKRLRRAACVWKEDRGPVWVPSKNVKPVLTHHDSSSEQEDRDPDSGNTVPSGNDSPQD